MLSEIERNPQSDAAHSSTDTYMSCRTVWNVLDVMKKLWTIWVACLRDISVGLTYMSIITSNTIHACMHAY